MGPFVAYSIYSSILLLALYVSYKWALAGENQHRYNRMALWAIYAVALLAYPASHIISQMMTTAGNPTVDIQATITGIMLQPEDLSAASQPLYLSILIWTYISGMAAAIIYTVITIFKLCRVINNGDKRHYDTYTLVLTADTRIAPFSWGRYVVMSYPDWDDNGEMILTHELRHIQHMHCIDLMFAQSVCIFQWFNPAAWLMREELKTVHEYQADSAVIASGVNIRDYQMLLIKKAVGARFPSLANSLNHSKLKKRITMMYNSNDSRARRLRGLALVPALAAALFLTDLPAVAALLSDTSSAQALIGAATGNKGSENTSDNQTATGLIAMTDPQPEANSSAQKATGNTTKKDNRIYDVVEEMPRFPGGDQALFKFLAENVRYPEAAMKANIQGRVVAQFVVTSTGAVGDVRVVRGVSDDLDAEAVRVIKSLPDFTPGKVNGKPVSVWYTLPISFTLTDDGKKDSAAPADNKVEKSTIVIKSYTGSASDEEPIIYIDGVKQDITTLKVINPDKIESIDVDKSSGTPIIKVVTKKS
ncbi:MAG: M56 family metallopeptidase [Muribaculaceae bacterium]|nr:M56 family metallopeptidase [Muribaculaceae bacterium]